MDIEAFSEDSFNSVEWINFHYRNYTDKTNKKQFINSFVSKLQLYVQQVNFAVEDASNQALSNLVRVTKDTKNLHSDVASLRSQMTNARSEFLQVQKETGNCMETLEKLNALQTRLQTAKDSLKESDGWGNLVAKLEDSFEQNDLPNICEKILALQKSLIAQEKLSGHADRVSQVDDFKNRLEALASPVLVQAFASEDIAKSQKYTQIFTLLNRTPQLIQYYRAVHNNALQQKWKELADLNSNNCVLLFSEFYEYLTEYNSRQSKWCVQVFGEEYQNEPGLTMTKLLPNLQPPRESVLLQSLKSTNEKLELLEKIATLNKNFASSLCKQMTKINEEQSVHLAESIFGYFVKFIQQYPKFEEQYLNSLMTSSLALKDVSPADAIRTLEHGNKKAFEWLHDSSNRCEKITDNYAIGELIPYLEEILRNYLENYTKVLRQISLSIHSEQTWSLMQNCLVLLQHLADFQTRLWKLRKHLTTKVQDFIEKQQNANNQPIEICFGALKMSEIKKLQRNVKDIKITEKDEEGMFWRIFESLKTNFVEAHDITLNILLSPIEKQLRHIKPMDDLTSSNATSDLPSFSFAPQECITQVGQYLLTLPQHLEPLLLTPSNLLKIALEMCNIRYSENIPCVDVLLALVVEQCCVLYQGRILQLKSLSSGETKQITVDIEYLKNIIEELGLTVSMHLNQMLTLLKAPAETYLSLSSGCEPRLVTAVRQMRNIISTE